MLFLSDNYYLCTGATCSRLNVRFISGMKDLISLREANPLGDFIVAIEHDLMRNKAIQLLKLAGCRYIVLLNEIEKDCYLKIEDIIYSSLRIDITLLQRLMTFLKTDKQHHFTRREYDVLKLAHLENHKIATELNLSQKTTSSYRIRIQEKLNMRTKNVLAMHRIKSAIVDQRF